MKNKSDFLGWAFAGTSLLIGVGLIAWAALHYSAPKKALSIKELAEKNRDELSEVMPEQNAALVDVFYHMPNGRQKAEQIATDSIKHMKTQDGQSLSQENIEQQSARVQEILQEMDRRVEENEALKNSPYNQRKNENWRKTLPLHKSNLSFRGPKGEEPLSHEEITCPPNIENRRDKDAVCYKYSYGNNVESIFFFEKDVLLERDDLQNHRATVRYRFIPVPFYTEKDNPGYAGILKGTVFLGYHYDPKYDYPTKEFYYGFDGLLARATFRDFEQKQQIEVSYMSDSSFYLYERFQLVTDAKQDITEGTPLMRLEIHQPPVISDENPDPHVYFMDIVENGQKKYFKGKWTGNAEEEIVLDNGMRFPSAKKENTPTYCLIYPRGCKVIH